MKQMYFFVEGEDDERFVRRIVEPLLEGKGFIINGLYKYAEEKPEKVKDCYNNIKKFCEVYFLTDYNDSPCITARKKRINKKYSVDFEDIVVVKPEIEAWYLAGVTDSIIRNTSIPKSVRKRFKKLGLPNDCEKITKEDFNQYIPRSLERRAFMSLILDHYDLRIAITKNKSLNRFITKVLGVKV